jgi:hypothetical protein
VTFPPSAFIPSTRSFSAAVQGNWKVYENGRAVERAFLSDRGELYGNATIKGNAPDYGGAKVSGYAIVDGDCANSANVDHQVLLCWVLGIDQKYADGRPDTGGLYCRYAFTRQSPIYALDHFGVIHGCLMAAPRTVAIDDKGCPNALELNGKDQYVELKRHVADFKDTTIAVWVNWAGGPADQQILHFGDGGSKYVCLTPKDAATGKLKFAITTTGKSGEQALVGTSALPVGAWTHVAVTLKGDTGTLYVDGKAVATSDAMKLDPDLVLAPNTLAGNDCMFLARGPGGAFFKGLLTGFCVVATSGPLVAHGASGPLAPTASVIAALAEQIKNRMTAAVAAPRDTTPPRAAASGFLMNPTALDGSAVVMSAPNGTDDSHWVEYFAEATSGPLVAHGASGPLAPTAAGATTAAGSRATAGPMPPSLQARLMPTCSRCATSPGMRHLSRRPPRRRSRRTPPHPSRTNSSLAPPASARAPSE